MRLATVLILSALFPAPLAAAPQDAALLDRLAGSWQGQGTLQDGGGAKPISCSLQGRSHGAKLTISGSCSGAAKGAKMAGQLRWAEGPGLYVGRLQGASLSGTRELSGKRRGDALHLRISGDDAARNLALKVSGNALHLTISDARGTTLLDLPLTKR